MSRASGLARTATITQVPVDPHVSGKGIPTTGLLAQVLVAKYADHLPLYRQEAIFGRAGLAIPCSTLAQCVGLLRRAVAAAGRCDEDRAAAACR
ncbi:transposase [Hydrogenophaga sp.]|uniref:IS66 family transposase n=1 Tax=Hydrogenophaga sp. TaxID=1904254 RepID=UPI00351D604E